MGDREQMRFSNPFGEKCSALRVCRWAVSAVVFAAVLMPAMAQQKSEDRSERSLDDLMNLRVTFVSKKEQKLSQTASAVFVITQEDILRSRPSGRT